jgi:hypothetical protein
MIRMGTKKTSSAFPVARDRYTVPGKRTARINPWPRHPTRGLNLHRCQSLTQSCNSSRPHHRSNHSAQPSDL